MKQIESTKGLREGQIVYLEYRGGMDAPYVGNGPLWYSGLARIEKVGPAKVARLLEPENKTPHCYAWGPGFLNLNFDPKLHLVFDIDE